MRYFTRLIFFGFCLLVLISCEKDGSIDTTSVTPGGTTGTGNGNAGGGETGNWKFISFGEVTTQAVEVNTGSDVIKTVTTRNYISESNTGNIRFDGNAMFFSKLAFAVNTITQVSFYTNDVFDATQQMPFTGTLPATTSTAYYKKIGTDSLYFAVGVVTGLGLNGSVETKPAGYKLTFNGNKLYLTLAINETTTQTVAGVTQKVTTNSTNVTTLQKM
ncbi:MAG TPA: hypothetical protein VM187_09120 [Niastella sp.]|nr:hypothetical protein [Niastella sp.]